MSSRAFRSRDVRRRRDRQEAGVRRNQRGRRPAQDGGDGDGGQFRRRCMNVCEVTSVGGSAFIRKSACGARVNVEGEGAAGVAR
jgi:hypothetical protein